MKKRISGLSMTVFIVLTVLIGLVFLGAGVLTAVEEPAPPEEVMIDNQGYKKDIKGPVKLSHKKHNEAYKVACTECHHEYKDGKNVWKEGDPVKKCADCHSPQKKEGNVHKLNLAYHKNCKDCHKEAVAEGKKAPSKCTECHQ